MWHPALLVQNKAFTAELHHPPPSVYILREFHFVTQAGLELLMLLFQPPECCGYRHHHHPVPISLSFCFALKFTCSFVGVHLCVCVWTYIGHSACAEVRGHLWKPVLSFPPWGFWAWNSGCQPWASAPTQCIISITLRESFGFALFFLRSAKFYWKWKNTHMRTRNQARRDTLRGGKGISKQKSLS